MQLIPKDLILRRLKMDNPWWSQAPHPFTDLAPRPYLELFLPLVKTRSIRRAVVLMGPRRVGKTVMIHHAIERLLQEGTDPKQICYVSIDNPVYVHQSLEQLLDLFAEATEVDYSKTPTFIFFDEIQYLRDWERHLKSLVDSHFLVKCVASGSAAAALRLKSNESGAGRFTDFLLPPLTFHEYLSLSKHDELVEMGKGAAKCADIETLNRHFIDYLNFGGYPEVALNPAAQEDPGRFIKNDIIDKVLLRDLPSLYGIRDIQELNALFTSLAFNSAQEVSLDNLAKSSGVAKQTIKRYIEYLEAAFLIRVVSRIDRTAKRFERARTFKVYLTNPSMRTALFGAISEKDEIGSIVETAIFAQWFHSPVELHYARWNKGEVDIVYLSREEKVNWALEVKWSDNYLPHPEKLREQCRFCCLHQIPRLAVTTRSQSGTSTSGEVSLQFMPAAVYCYQVGFNIVKGKYDAMISKIPKLATAEAEVVESA